MSEGSTFDTKEQVRQAIDIVELVGQHIPLRRQGRNYTGLCPWHEDTKPSLQVNPDRQTFKCWVCDIGGDVFSFVMRREGVEFSEALAMLAERAGIEIRRSRDSAGGDQPARQSKQHLYRVAAWAEQQFHECLLNDPMAEAARRYLEGRRIDDANIRKFHLGYAPDQWDWILKQAASTEFTTADLEKIGVAATSTRTGRHYDRFKGRLLFSIRDSQNRAIALGGRVLPGNENEQPAKYINSPETLLFSKSNQLYGLDVAREAIQKSGHALVMEGYTDCIIAHQFGLENTLACLGTALGERHVQLLNRYAQRITLVLDGDEAGQRRANEILDLFVAGAMDLRVLTLPEGLDPCDFLLERGADAFQDEMERAVDALDHKVRVATRGVDAGDGSHDANRALEDVLQTLAKSPRLQLGTKMETKLREDQFLARLARQFRVDELALRSRLVALRRVPARRPRTSDEPPQVRREIQDPWERELIEIILQEPEAISRIAESIRPEQLNDDVCRRIYARCVELSTAGTNPDLDRLLLEFDEPDYKSLLVELDERGRDRGGSDLAQQLPDLLASFRRRREAIDQQATMAALRDKHFDEKEEVTILNELLEKQRARHRDK